MEIDIFSPHPSHSELFIIEKWRKEYPWLVAGFTSRKNGYSSAFYESFNCGLHVGDAPHEVIKNREKLLHTFQLTRKNWVSANQTHSANIYYVSDQDRGKGLESMDSAIPDVDALYTDQPDLFLASFYADCVPLFFLDPINKVIGLAHAGWKGTAQQIGLKLVQQWQTQFNSSLAHILVAIGPSIGSCCYEVDKNVIRHFMTEKQTYSEKVVFPKTKGKYQLDLKQCNYELLIQAGITDRNIEVSRWCTSCRTDLFYSHRREHGRTGRMSAFMSIQEEEIRS